MSSVVEMSLLPVTIRWMMLIDADEGGARQSEVNDMHNEEK